MRQRLNAWAKAIKRDTMTLYLAARDPRVPWYAKAVAAAVAAYALSPIDLIPDFIPLIGYLDDLIILPLGILLVIKMIPPELLAELREKADTQLKERPRSIIAAVVIILIWLGLLALTGWLFAGYFERS